MLFLDIVLVFVINVHVGSLYIGKAFKLALQGLADIVGYLEWHILIHDYIYFDIVVLASMVGSALSQVNRRSDLGQDVKHLRYQPS